MTDLKPDDLVFMERPRNPKTGNLRFPPGISPKLSYPVTGPYRIIKNEYPLFIVDISGIHTRVHVNRLTPAPSNTPVTQQPSTEYEIDRLINHGYDDNNLLKFRVRWKNFRAKDDTWEYQHDLPETIVSAYLEKLR
eukprot:Plantae.Rhodophyta-Hildenbrandia_rubra.ctg29896.p1 GENE.Plantae.Rhodophyta-Hildenbrandia_rubra.ctg29896~~Plantae.Rhodophyta-Hildenbrandia_rubra.ctg29896.p1  ORF type:complete len:136 (+),score=1.13 Plantae.Rhodophyta-Hildenbrandia_rubra.ctg29896:3-410(+)